MNRPHIAIFGRCNAGKSSLMNLITGTDTAIVSPHGGTTTDVVRKIYEITGFAPVVLIDTAGLDDTSSLGAQRIAKTMECIYQIDLGIIVFRAWGRCEQSLVDRFRTDSIPFIAIRNVVVGSDEGNAEVETLEIDVKNGGEKGRDKLLEEIKRLLPEESYRAESMLSDRVVKGDIVLLVCPIDSQAPAGRLILAQVQTIRELLDNHAITIIVQVEELAGILACGLAPTLIVADSQVLKEVEAMVPAGIEITTFSILLAAAKGDYNEYLKGLEAVDRLKEGSWILIAENCSHQTSCDDIGRVKIPRWLEDYTGLKLKFTFVSALAALPDNLGSYALVVQCGGCMVTRNQIHNRIRRVVQAGVPITNYGMLIRKIRS